MNIEKLVCPVCGGTLVQQLNIIKCSQNHCFDIAKEGYVNLLTGKHKSGELMGDNKSMAKARRMFLRKDYYLPLAEFLSDYVAKNKCETVVDICCGEGYYSRKILERNRITIYGFDLSKEMVKLAAKSEQSATFFVANLAHIPVANESMDLAIHLFAPFNSKEFSRIIKPSGRLLSVVPGENHLFGLKKVLYDSPYKNDEALPESRELKLIEKHKVISSIVLTDKNDIQELFSMTPYYYHTSDKDKAKLENIQGLETEIEFVIGEYERA